MDNISTYLTDEHHRCDELFAQAEESVGASNWADSRAKFEAFHQAIEQHFAKEEGVLFPSFEQATGSTMGPTQVMRTEHVQIRELVNEMLDALAHEDRERYLGLSETLLVMMQQHNIKEEQILYPMSDQVLANKSQTLLRDMADVH